MTSIVHYQDALHRPGVLALWHAVFKYDQPYNAPALSIDKKRALQDDLFFVAMDRVAVVGTIFAGYDGHRGWLYSVAVDPARRGQGLGVALVRHAEQALTALGCVKINLQVMPDNVAVVGFYERLGYVVEQRISMGRRLPVNVPAGS